MITFYPLLHTMEWLTLEWATPCPTRKGLELVYNNGSNPRQK